MAEFIVNPRRAPRAPARCRAAVVSPAGAFQAETEDVSSRGCQVVSPRLVRKGDALELTLACDKVSDALKAKGKVTWVSEQAPWRVGVAFEDAYVPSAERWFEKLVAATPGLGSFRRVPQKIPVEAMVYLGPPPRFLLDFTAEEASLLRAIASGVRLDELMARLRDSWPSAQRALFSLLARQAVTLARGQAAHPEAWKKILTEVEASLAVESLDGPLPTPPPAPPRAEPVPTPMPVRRPASPLPPPPGAFGQNPAASPWGTAARDPHPSLELDEAGPPLDVSAPTPPRGAGRSASAAGWGTPQAPEARRAGGWGEPAHERGPEAQALYERALLEIEAGHVNGAIALLRKALTHSPHDPEISATLGKLAFRDRMPGGG
jgi:PilZ domain